MRLDLFLAEKGVVSSRTRASNLIELGRVSVNGVIVKKSSLNVSEVDKIEISEDYEASLGGIKLKEGLKYFSVDCKGKICVDIGAANGGFTDVLLKNGAKTVYAVDVGECAFGEELKNDERVVVMDRINARYLVRDNFNPSPELGVIDVSFISLKLILPSVISVMQNNAEILALIKPQFECEKKDLTKKGILSDKKLTKRIIAEIERFATSLGAQVIGIIPAPHPFERKNEEYLIYLKI